MKPAAETPTTNSVSGKPHLSVGSVGLQLLDTTWRIAVPVLLFALVGIWGDRRFGSKPWLTLLGTILGFVIAGWLIKLQLDAVNREESAK